MGIFRVDHAEFLEDVHALIDATDTSKHPSEWHPNLLKTIDDLIDRHRVSLTKSADVNGTRTYGAQIGKLLMACNKERAHKLADSIGSSGLTWTGDVVFGGGSWLLNVLFLVGGVVLIVLLVLHFTGR